MTAVSTIGGSGRDLDSPTEAALAELLLQMADDEFVIGFWDSEWTGIAPMLEEDVAFSSIAQDEIGHARALYELLAQLTGDDADRIAYGRSADEYRHARLLNHARGDWAFTIARRYFYDSADAVRLEALSRSSYGPLAQLVSKIRREETYHLMHMDAWLRRLAAAREPARERLVEALHRLWPDAPTVFTPLSGAAESALLAADILPESMSALGERWLAAVRPTFRELDLPFPPLGDRSSAPDATGRLVRNEDFRWLWSEFTMVHRSEVAASW